ncbi:MAG: hypothetical protein KFH98_15025 [Gemmatimonadetes bacterium]|nr:hypothetical protein [Gemmatimonadota bacterium]
MTGQHSDEDTAMRELLRAHAPEPPLLGVDWAALHARTTAAAAPLLRRRTGTWWQLLGSAASRNQRVAAAAACISLLLATGVAMPDRPAPAVAQTEFRTIEEELAFNLPYASVPLLAADASNGDVIDALLLYDREEW